MAGYSELFFSIWKWRIFLEISHDIPAIHKGFSFD